MPPQFNGGFFQRGNVLRIRTVGGAIPNNGDLLLCRSLTVTGNDTQTTSGELLENREYRRSAKRQWERQTVPLLGLSINPTHPPKEGSADTVMTFGSLGGEFTSVSNVFSVKCDNNSVVATHQ